MSEPQPEAISDETETPDQTASIVATFPSIDSITTKLEIKNTSPLQLWAVARLLEFYAEQMYAAEVSGMAAAAAQQDRIAIARQMPSNRAARRHNGRSALT